MVFQSYAVWPHMTVFDNVAYGLKVRKYPKDEIRKRVTATLELVGLIGLDRRYATQLSGGQQQRVALARSIVLEPSVCLLDEPLSNLDAKLRQSMRFELKELQRKLGITTVYVTHDQEEAMTLSDTVILMNKGKIVQMGKPLDIYQKPKSRFAVRFFGLTNSFVGNAVESPIRKDFGMVELEEGISIHCNLPEYVKTGDRLHIYARPHMLKIYKKRPKHDVNLWEAKITKFVHLGNLIDYTVRVGVTELRIRTDASEQSFNQGEMVYVYLNPEVCFVYPA